MRLTIDVSQVLRQCREAERILDRQPAQMKEVLDSFAEAERHEHAFTNRTGALESSIYASELIEVGDQAVVEFGAHEEYAEFVERRGYMDMEGQAQAAENEIESLLDSNAITIGAL